MLRFSHTLGIGCLILLAILPNLYAHNHHGKRGNWHSLDSEYDEDREEHNDRRRNYRDDEEYYHRAQRRERKRRSEYKDEHIIRHDEDWARGRRRHYTETSAGGNSKPVQQVNSAKNAKPTPIYDYYILAMAWRGAFCKRYTKCPEIPRSSEPKKFGLHGLWPSLKVPKPGVVVESCTEDKFKFSSLSKKVQELVKLLWSKDTNFIGHEFEKHGTCWVSDSDKGTQQENYILKSLELYDQYSKIYESLEKASILPSMSKVYPISDVIGAIKAGLKIDEKKFVVTCGSQNNELTEVRICLDMSYSPTDCPVDSKCTTDIYYPPFFQTDKKLEEKRLLRQKQKAEKAAKFAKFKKGGVKKS